MKNVTHGKEGSAENTTEGLSTAEESRRRFLAACGRFAAVTPPAITLLLAGGHGNYAVAQSGEPPTSSSGGRVVGPGDISNVQTGDTVCFQVPNTNTVECHQIPPH